MKAPSQGATPGSDAPWPSPTPEARRPIAINYLPIEQVDPSHPPASVEGGSRTPLRAGARQTSPTPTPVDESSTSTSSGCLEWPRHPREQRRLPLARAARKVWIGLDLDEDGKVVLRNQSARRPVAHQSRPSPTSRQVRASSTPARLQAYHPFEPSLTSLRRHQGPPQQPHRQPRR